MHKAPINSVLASPSMRQWSVWLVLLAAAATFALTMGTRQSMGLFISPINSATHLGLAQISLAFALGQLWWGLTQPFAGAMADRIGAGRVLLIGVLLVALGTFITPYMTSTWGLIFAVGLLSAGGAGMAGPAVLMGAATRLLPERHRGMATGIINAGGSTGQFLITPLAGALVVGMGWANALQVMAVLVLVALPAIFVLKGKPEVQPVSSHSAQSSLSDAGQPQGSRAVIAQAFGNRSYVLLCVGFFVCGFHVAFLATHLPGVIESCGLPVQFGAWALAMLGLFNIVGSLAMGWAVGRWRMKSLLSLVYAVRAVAVLIFMLTPKTGAVALIFAAVMGLTFLSTVPPTVGLIAKFFGTRHIAMLFGLMMMVHQMGGFLGAWLGGKVFEANGNFDIIWIIDILLAVAAALIHLPIREAKLARRNPSAETALAG